MKLLQSRNLLVFERDRFPGKVKVRKCKCGGQNKLTSPHFNIYGSVQISWKFAAASAGVSTTDQERKWFFVFNCMNEMWSNVDAGLFPSCLSRQFINAQAFLLRAVVQQMPQFSCLLTFWNSPPNSNANVQLNHKHSAHLLLLLMFVLKTWFIYFFYFMQGSKETNCSLTQRLHRKASTQSVERKIMKQKTEKIEKSPNEKRVIGIEAHNVEIIAKLFVLNWSELYKLKTVAQADFHRKKIRWWEQGKSEFSDWKDFCMFRFISFTLFI